MYQVENSIMDHVINRAIGVNRVDSVSSVKEISMFSVGVVINGISDNVNSLLFNNELIGMRLIRKSSIRFFFACCG